MKILVSGFEPFGNDTINPSEEILKLLPSSINGAQIITVLLPVVRHESFELLKEMVEKEQPDYVISLGLAAGRKAVTPERIAVNLDDYRIPDNKGNQPCDEPVCSEGPAAYFSALPLRRIEKALKEKEYPVSLSCTAGTFVCNHVFYALRHYCELMHLKTKSGFIHVPWADEMGESPYFSMPLSQMADAVKTVIGVIAGEDS